MQVKTKLQITKRTHSSIYLLYIIEEKFAPWEFYMQILMQVFHKTQEEARAIADTIQRDGEALCGAYIYEIAETKAMIIEKEAKREGLSLQCLLEEV